MQDETDELSEIGAMQKDREVMPDGRRYIIYYTFGEREQQENVTDV